MLRRFNLRWQHAASTGTPGCTQDFTLIGMTGRVGETAAGKITLFGGC